MICFLKEFHGICEQKLGKGKVYLHGKYDNEDIVYDGENVKALKYLKIRRKTLSRDRLLLP